MIELIHTFFAGITFSVGVLAGAILCQMASKQGRKDAVEEARKTNEKIHERLNESLFCHQRMADSLEIFVELKRKDS